jgi:hypothetical protein
LQRPLYPTSQAKSSGAGEVYVQLPNLVVVVLNVVTGGLTYATTAPRETLTWSVSMEMLR